MDSEAEESVLPIFYIGIFVRNHCTVNIFSGRNDRVKSVVK